MRTSILTTMLMLGTATGCSSQLQPIDDEGGGEGEVMPLHVAEAFERACGTAACHGGSQSPSLTAAAAPGIVGAASTQSSLPLVELGNLQGSYIAVKMLADELLDDPSSRTGGMMPVPGQMADPADLTLILGWIASTPPSAGGGDGGTGDDGGDDGADDGADTAGESTGMSEPQLCGLEDLVPGTASPVVFGDEADVIPTEIGMIIENNCGCHLAANDQFPMGIFAPGIGIGTDFTTLAGIRANIPGVAMRVVDAPNAMPPPNVCAPMDVQALSQADFDALSMWLAMDAPDGATWGS